MQANPMAAPAPSPVAPAAPAAQQTPPGAPPPPGPLASVAPMPAPKMASMSDAWARAKSWRGIIGDMQAAGQAVPAHVQAEYANAMKSFLAHGAAHAASAAPVAAGVAHAAQQLPWQQLGQQASNAMRSLRPAPSPMQQLGHGMGIGALGGLGALGVYQLGKAMFAPKPAPQGSPPGGV